MSSIRMVAPDDVVVNGRLFRRFLSAEDIASIVRRLAEEVGRDYEGKNPLLCPVLTGAYIFAADLSRALHVEHEVSFVRYSSYEGMKSSGEVRELLPFGRICEGRHVIIVEDIVESGLCMSQMLRRVWLTKPASVAICSFFFKPNCFKQDFKIDYIGHSISDDFVLGYGLDYDGAARGLDSVYVLSKEESR